MTLRKHSSALPAAVLAAAVALAGCGNGSSSSGNNTPDPTPPPPEKTSLQKAQDGAMEASRMTQQQSEEARSKADEADDALEGIVLLRTGYQGGEHVRQGAPGGGRSQDSLRHGPGGSRQGYGHR